jgi:hypothetical protein
VRSENDQQGYSSSISTHSLYMRKPNIHNTIKMLSFSSGCNNGVCTLTRVSVVTQIAHRSWILCRHGDCLYFTQPLSAQVCVLFKWRAYKQSPLCTPCDPERETLICQCASPSNAIFLHRCDLHNIRTEEHFSFQHRCE